MGDRRMGDRREREKGVIKIKFKDAIIYIIIAALFIISVSVNIIFINLYSKYKKDYESIVEYYANQYSKNEELENSEQNNYTCDLKIVGDKSKVLVGETVTYEIKAENIQAGAGIVMFESLINYDENTFDCQVENDKDGIWSRTGMIEHYLTMTKSDLEPTSKNQTIARVKLTVKQDATEGNKVIEFKKNKFTADDGKSFSVIDETINIEVSKN